MKDPNPIELYGAENLEVQAARDFLFECLYTFSDKRTLWLAEKASEIYSYENKGKSKK